MSLNKITDFIQKHKLENGIKVAVLLITLFLIYRIFVNDNAYGGRRKKDMKIKMTGGVWALGPNFSLTDDHVFNMANAVKGFDNIIFIYSVSFVFILSISVFLL